jgi:signal transduction histidine kinase
MTLWAIPRLYRRAILIYAATIVFPVGAFLWMGIDTLEQQRALLAAQKRAQLDLRIAAATETAARAAFADATHPMVAHRFEMEAGELVRPALRSPLRQEPPAAYGEAYRYEAMGDYDAALRSFQTLTRDSAPPGLALFGVARTLDKLGRKEEARAAWQRLARDFADERDLSNRPFGIVAAIEAGDTDGLFEAIGNGRWDLSEDQADFFLEQLAPGRPSPLRDRFTFARYLREHFNPPAKLTTAEVFSQDMGPFRVFYKSDGDERVVGFAANDYWLAAMRSGIAQDLDVEGTAGGDVRLYAGSVAMVLVVLSAGVVLLLRDVSREARTNRMRAELVSGISHELKTPITLVRLYSETLLRQSGFSDEERLGFYRIIARESTRLGRLIDQVLTFSRVDRGGQSYHLEPADLAPVVSGVVDDYREYLEHLGFCLRQQVPESLPPVRFDGTAISQALLNLLDNAVKYSGKSRHIGVRVAVQDAQVAVEVEDHGVGIAPEDQDRIFERFYRVPNGSGKGGYGLGLFLVRHIMEAHGGRAEVESAPGQGSRFRLVLPTVAS